MLGQRLIQKCVIRFDQFHHGTVIPYDAVEIELCLLLHRLTQTLIKGWETCNIGLHNRSFTEIQPLSCKVLRK